MGHPTRLAGRLIEVIETGDNLFYTQFMAEECTRDWVKQELILWEKGFEEKFEEFKKTITALEQRIRHLENHLDPL